MIAASAGRSVDGYPFTGRAFGLRLRSTFAIPGVADSEDAREPAAPIGRVVELSLEAADRDQAAWSAAPTERTVEQAGPDGEPILTVDRHPSLGYRLWIAGLGHCIVAADGTQIVVSLPRDSANRWRLLLGQGLPTAAALLGLEVLHASAVAVDGRAVAFSAPSGTGKTSLTINLLADGAQFLSDDVLALETTGSGLSAHPGVRIAHVHHHEEAALRAAGIDLVASMRSEGKQDVVMPAPDGAAPLAALYFLHRLPAAARTQIRRLDSPDPRLLLGATFVTHLPEASRRLAQLDICSRLASTVPIFMIEAPADGSSREVADQVARHLEAVL